MVTMLIVDDDKKEHEVIEYLLNKYHFSIETVHAEDGLQAKHFLESQKFDILLTDIQMPFFSGLELAKLARIINPEYEILFFSGYDDFSYIKEALELKAINYILKPIDMVEFQKSMQEILDNISRKRNPYLEYEKSISQNFHKEREITISRQQITSDVQDGEILKSIEEAVRLSNTTQLEQGVSLLIQKYETEVEISHIYIRYLFTSLLHILIHCIPDVTEEELQQAIEKIYTLNHFSELCEYINQYLARTVKQLRQMEGTPNYAVYHTMQYIEQHYAEDLSLDYLADMVYLSPKYLSTIFAQVTGNTLNKYIRSIRMKKAIDLIMHSNRRISDISVMVGYQNVSYFCKLFTEEYGVTPEKYRVGKDDR